MAEEEVGESGEGGEWVEVEAADEAEVGEVEGGDAAAEVVVGRAGDAVE